MYLTKTPAMSVEDCAERCLSEISCVQFSIMNSDSNKTLVNTTSGTLQDGVKCQFGSSNVLQPDDQYTTYILPGKLKREVKVERPIYRTKQT